MSAVPYTWDYSLASDPGIHTVAHVQPDGSPTTYQYPVDSDIVAAGGGDYSITVDVSMAGIHLFTETDDMNGSQTFTLDAGSLLSQIDQLPRIPSSAFPGGIG